MAGPRFLEFLKYLERELTCDQPSSVDRLLAEVRRTRESETEAQKKESLEVSPGVPGVPEVRRQILCGEIVHELLGKRLPFSQWQKRFREVFEKQPKIPLAGGGPCRGYL